MPWIYFSVTLFQCDVYTESNTNILDFYVNCFSNLFEKLEKSTVCNHTISSKPSSIISSSCTHYFIAHNKNSTVLRADAKVSVILRLFLTTCFRILFERWLNQ